jgi:hypothetical protein
MWYERIVYCKSLDDSVNGTIVIFETDNTNKIIVTGLNDDSFIILVNQLNNIDYKIIANTIQNYYTFEAKYEEIIHSGDFLEDISGINDNYIGYFENDKFIFTKPKNYLDELYEINNLSSNTEKIL